MSMIKLYSAIATWSDCYKTAKPLKSPVGIVVHSTGCNNPNLKRYANLPDKLGENVYKNYWGTGSSTEQANRGIPHAAVGYDKSGNVAAVQVLPFDIRCWGCGSGKNGSYNTSHIQFEICEDGLKDEKYFSLVYKESVELTAHLCKMYGLDPLADGVVIDHKEGSERGIASGHGDVGHWFPKFGKTMDDFRKDVKAKMEENKRHGNNPTKCYKEATEWAINKGIFRGDGKGNYYWQDNVTREQLAQVLYNINRMESL